MDRLQELVKQAIFAAFGAVLLTSAAWAVGLLCPRCGGDPLLLGLLASILALLLALTVWLIIVALRRGSLPLMVSAAVVLLLTGSVAFLLFIAWKTETVVFIVDASRNSLGRSDEVKDSVENSIAAVPDRNDVALIVFGNFLSRSTGCADVSVVLEPTQKQKALDALDARDHTLFASNPNGAAAVQEAVLRAIDELRGGSGNGTHEIFVITSGLPSGCASLDRAEVDKAALDAGVRYRLKVGIIGDQLPEDKRIFEAYADEYMPLPTIGGLAEAVERHLEPILSPYNIFSSEPGGE